MAYEMPWLRTVSTEDGQNFFQPFTTTLIELILNRDPLPFNSNRVKLCYFEEFEVSKSG